MKQSDTEPPRAVLTCARSMLTVRAYVLRDQTWRPARRVTKKTMPKELRAASVMATRTRPSVRDTVAFSQMISRGSGALSTLTAKDLAVSRTWPGGGGSWHVFGCLELG